jgi:hypothetical protein
MPMDWFSISEEDWFSIKEGTDKGLEDGKITLQLKNNSDKQRIGKITVYAFDAANPEQEVTIVQNGWPAGIPEQRDDKSGISVYPNPANNEIWIQLLVNPDNDYYAISIITLDGQVLFSDELLHNSAEPNKISVGHLPQGMYILKVAGGAGSWYRSFTRM